VSQAIEVILVPDEKTRVQVTGYIVQHAEKFRAGGPIVRIFPDGNKMMLNTSEKRLGVLIGAVGFIVMVLGWLNQQA
jgi:hypothetical protein